MIRFNIKTYIFQHNLVTKLLEYLVLETTQFMFDFGLILPYLVEFPHKLNIDTSMRVRYSTINDLDKDNLNYVYIYIYK